MHDFANPIENSKIYSIVRSYIANNKCIIKWHHNIPLETPIILEIETRFTDISCRFLEPVPNRPAILIINNEDRFRIMYEDYIDLFMPVGVNDEIKAESPDKLADLFDFSDTDRLLSLLSKIGASEVSNFDMHEDINDVVTQIKDNKIIQTGLDELEEVSDLESEGWVKINDTQYCYCPMSNYIIWGEIDSDDLRIIIY